MARSQISSKKKGNNGYDKKKNGQMCLIEQNGGHYCNYGPENTR